MTILNIRIQRTAPESFRDRDVTFTLKRILDSSAPVVLTLSAVYDGKIRTEGYQPEILELIREIGQRENSFIGQQGALGGPCPHKHRVTDRWHENACLYPWNRAPSKKDQEELMLRGKGIIEHLAGTSPVFFAPSNHLYNHDTLDAAAELGYKYFGDRAMIPIHSYRIGSLIVVPEATLEKGALVDAQSHYIHYDRIEQAQAAFNLALTQATPLADIQPSSEIPFGLIERNRRRKLFSKFVRDLVKAPKNIAQKF
jgi:hypothetical protein